MIKGKGLKDHYFDKAKREGYLSRAVYKLMEVDKKYHLLKPGMKILDLGSAPGSWLQWIAKRIGKKGYVVGIDLQEINYNFPKNVMVIRGDMTDPEFVNDLIEKYDSFDVVLSDMAPFTSGNKATDSARCAALAEQAFFVALNVLRKGGSFFVKIFYGSDFHGFLSSVKKEFKQVRVVKPNASIKQSKETYVLGMGFKMK